MPIGTPPKEDNGKRIKRLQFEMDRAAAIEALKRTNGWEQLKAFIQNKIDSCSDIRKIHTGKADENNKELIFNSFMVNRSKVDVYSGIIDHVEHMWPSEGKKAEEELNKIHDKEHKNAKS